jgi:hypothetical protein
VTPSIKETVERLTRRADACKALSPTLTDIDRQANDAEERLLRSSAALIERLAGALDEIGKRYDERSPFDGPSFMADEMANIARRALSGEPT